MRLIHRVPFTQSEVENYRQLVFNNLTYGMKCVLDALDELQLQLSPTSAEAVQLVEEAPDIRDGEMYPEEYFDALQTLWEDPAIRQTIERGNEFALPEK
jgi:guanine nucleotide-binding protein subunit alpha